HLRTFPLPVRMLKGRHLKWEVLMSNRLSSDLITIDKSASLAEASEVMREEGIHHLVVVSGKQLLGVLSDRDALDAWVRAGGGDLNRLKVADAYRKDLPSITPDTSVQEAVTLMQREYSDALLVELNDTVGIVTTM